MGIREYFSIKGRELCEKELSWNKICKQWDNILSMARIDNNKPYPVINLPKPVRIEDILDKEKKDRILFVMPGTFGDVFISTAITNSIKTKYPDKDIYFATHPKFNDILNGNTDIYKILQYDGIFNNIPLMNNYFEIVFTPFTETQQSNNWTKNGHGKHFAQIYADHCQVPIGNQYIQIIEFQKAPEEYIAVHVKTGQEPKDYKELQKVVDQLDIPIIQIGANEDPLLKNVIDKRGLKINETAGVINKCKLFIGGDSICAHIAGYCDKPSILLYGSTFPNLTIPIRYNNTKPNVIEPNNRFGCDRPCHLAKCNKSPIGCINNIPVNVIVYCAKTVHNIKTKEAPIPTLSGYTTTFNPNKYYPWRESIKSLLGVCDEVVVVDGGCDGTLEELQEWKKTEPKLKVFKRRWKETEPTMDSQMKAYSRALCTKEFCIQLDCDEIIHECDYVKIQDLIKNMASTTKVITLPVIDLYGENNTVRSDRGLYKVRISRNIPEITHGIPAPFRKTDKNGKIYCDKNLSDGCELVNSQTFMPIDNHVTFHNQPFFDALNNNTSKYKELMIEAYKKFPSVWHFSWHSLERRINVDLEFWDKQWSILNNSELPPENRFFPGIKRENITPEMIKERAEFLKDKKLDGTIMDKIKIDWIDIPEVIKDWLK